jgi:hypothetical protein
LRSHRRRAGDPPVLLGVAQLLAAVDTVGDESTSAAVRSTAAYREGAVRRSIEDEPGLEAITLFIES